MQRSILSLALIIISCLVLFMSARADIYMHNPRGSNDRGCETNDNRNNGNRLFDSQNNAKGGYACGSAYPFACYLLPVESDREQCNNLNGNANNDDLTLLAQPLMDEGGLIVENNPTAAGGVQVATRTERLSFIEGSILAVEWTNQHGCGDNPKMHCDIIIQYACEDTLSDDCGEPGADKTCGPRDGLPITNSDNNRGTAQYLDILTNQNVHVNRRGRDRDATETIPVSISNNVQSDPRFGRHEPLSSFLECARRERNKGLFTADQNLNGDSAQNTRQNPNGNRHGYECAEESEYYPYWHPSPWKDVAILTDQVERCEEFQAESQNVKAKNFCDCPQCIENGQLVPNQEQNCLAAGGTFREAPAFGIPPPFCGQAPTTRENHLGNAVGDLTGAVTASSFNWTIPAQAELGGKTCVLRIRYNVSSGDDISADDPRDVALFGSNVLNGNNSPLKDRQLNEAQTYVGFAESAAKVGLELNTNQIGRTFQDRSISFSIIPRPTEGPCSGDNAKIYNLNVRGKRGNIVQVFPAVEYDFVPNELTVEEDDCVHVQWTGSDYNPARNDNDAFGGPNDPKDMNNGRADRSNLVEMKDPSNTVPVGSLENEMTLFTANLTQKLRLVFLDQAIDDPDQCLDIVQIQNLSIQSRNNAAQFLDNGNNFLDQDQDRDRFFKNCAKLSGARTPFFDGGLLQAGTQGDHFYFSTRNTCFGNRDQRGILRVVAAGALDAAGDELDLVPIVAGVGGGVVGLLAFAGLVAYRRRRRSNSNSNSSNNGGGAFNGFKERAQESFTNFRSSFANFGSGFHAFGGGSRQTQNMNNNNNMIGGDFGGGFNNNNMDNNNNNNFGGGGGGLTGLFRSSFVPWASNIKSNLTSFRAFGGVRPSAAMANNNNNNNNNNFGSVGGLSASNPGFPGASTSGSPYGGQSSFGGAPVGGMMMMGMGGSQNGMSSMRSQQSQYRPPRPPGMASTRSQMSAASATGGGSGGRATAMYDHVAQESGELNFQRGDTVAVLRRDASGWWEGECNGQRGIFPANYVRVESSAWN